MSVAHLLKYFDVKLSEHRLGHFPFANALNGLNGLNGLSINGLKHHSWGPSLGPLWALFSLSLGPL